MEHDQELKSTQPRGKGDRLPHPTFTAFLLVLVSLGCSCTAVVGTGAQPANPSDHSRSAEPAQNVTGRPAPAEKTPDAASAPTQQKNDPERSVTSHPEPLPGALSWKESHGAERRACGNLQCYALVSPERALLELMTVYAPSVLAFGEAHAPATYKGKSTVARFTESLLPNIAPRSRFLLVELLAPPPTGCEPARAEAERESAAITTGQRAENQNEYVALGKRARALGVVPDILRASCDDLRAIAAPEGGVLVYMDTIARLSSHELSERLDQPNQERPLVLSYGGALHNDAAPREERASWSFGPALLDKTQGRYLEVDLIVPALISDSETWRAFPWYDAYQAAAHKPGETLVIPWGEHSVALIFSPEP